MKNIIINEFNTYSEVQAMLRLIHHEFGGNAQYDENNRITDITNCNRYTTIYIEQNEGFETYYISMYTSYYSNWSENYIGTEEEIENFICENKLKALIN